MARNPLPTQDDMMKLPRWARVALAARTARRVQPLILAAWSAAPTKYCDAVELAIAEGESAASKANPTPLLRKAGMAAMDVYGMAPVGTSALADFITFGASRVSFAASQRTAEDAIHSMDQMRLAVHLFQRTNCIRGLTRVFNNAVWKDFELLLAEAKRLKWTHSTLVAPDVFGEMWPRGIPKNWPEPTIAPRKRSKPRLSTTNKQALEALPSLLKSFLEQNPNYEISSRRLECGSVLLKTLPLLEVGRFEITTEGTSEEEQDPKSGKDGYYILNAVDLVADCDGYDPEGILAWFIDYECFGCYDTDHHNAKMFLATSWTDIISKPVPFLNAQWNPGRRYAVDLSEPWKRLKWRKAKA